MKAYIKPAVSIEQIELQAILAGSVTGLEDVTESKEEFAGGYSDSRGSRSIWDDEE
ncbi:MAG: hypothetical protein IJ176_04470 [Prevotella sp.]|nr:hypothetical protein [Prevotella sp.]